MTKLKRNINEMEFNIPLQSLNTMDIYLKATVLPPTDKEPKKVLYGFKFDAKQRLTKESKPAVEDMIKSGDHLRHYKDFVSGKIASYFTARKIIEMAGFIAGTFSQGEKLDDFKDMTEALLNGFEQGREK